MPSERVQRRIDAMLDQIEVAVDEGNWERVRERSHDVLALDPENTDASDFVTAAERRLIKEASDLPPVSDTTSGTPSPPGTQVSEAEPTSFSDGRYIVKRFLGEGGKKKVYLATDTTLDRDIAFALIKTDGLDDIGRERIRREAQAMGRMGTHPCVMPIYDLGEENGQPFMVQPLMGGGDVEGLIEDAEGPLPLEQAILIATQTAQGLVFAHSKGIIHRDLKPGNIWLDEDGAAKIGDFGLAVATDRSRLTVEKLMVGTVNYMPPEQATGAPLTPRADLYSLGVMLYEMATGRVPFMGDDDIAVISQHVNTPPVAPSWHNKLIPKTLDALILRLMAKDPAERPESAEEVLAALGSVDLSAVDASSDGQERSLDSMADGVFVGRQREMDQLKSIFEEVLSGKGRMVMLVGEPGIGKTRTAQELATYAGMRGATVLWGRSYESGGAPPYWPWVQAVRSHVAATDEQLLRSQMGSSASVIAEVVADIREKLSDLPALTRIEDPESARFRLFDSISTFLKNLSRTEPLVLMLEDLHWADKPSLMLLEFVARELANSKILIVGNYRDVELNRRHPLSVTLGDLSRERLFERVVLRGLQRHDVARFIEIAAGISPPDALVNTVHSQTEGNPLFVTETVRLLIQEGVISAGQQSKGGTTSWEIRIPEGVREVIGRRLDRLSERCNELLTIAAVVGRQFHFDVLKALVEDTTDGQLLDAMDEALSARIIEEIPTEVGLYQFSHASMQETLTGELSLTRRVTVHARVAEALEKLYAEDLAAHAETLAYHFEQSQTIHGAEKMVKYSVIAGQAALDALGYDEALAHFRRAYEARKDDNIDEELAVILVGLARGELYTLQDFDSQGRAIGRLIRAFDFYRAVGDKERAAEVASIPFLGLYADNAVILTDRALEYLDPDSPGAAQSWSRKGLILAITKGEIEEGLAATQRGIDIAQRHGMAGAEAWGHDHRELIQMESGNFDEAIKSGEAGVAAAQRASDLRAAFLAHHFLFLSNVYIGNKDIAEHHFNLGIELVRQSRDKVRILQANSMGMGFRLVTGEYEHQVYDIEVDVKDGMGPPSLSYKAWSALEQGKDEEAQALFEQIKNEALRRLEQGIPAIGPAWIMATIVGLGIRSQVDLDRAGYDLILSSRYGEHFTAGLPYSRSGVAAAWAIQQKDIDHAPERYSALMPYRGRVVGWTSSDTLLGLLSVLMGDIDQASQHFEDAIKFCEKAGYRPELAWAQFHFAETLIGANRQPEKVAELQDGALAIANELGMKLLTRRVLAQLDILKA